MYRLLSGMRIVEASSFVASPSCGLHLAQFGAEVIRIDQIGGGPDYRRWPLAPHGDSFYWEGLNKSKKSIAIDLSRPEGRELALRVATTEGHDAGLFVTNYPVGGFLSYDRLRAARPDMICVRIMGWPDGRPAVDYTVNSAIGVPFMTGPTDAIVPVNHVLPAWDLMAGAYAAFALVAAERLRRMTGRGQEIRIPLADLGIAALGHLGQIGEVLVSGADRPRMGNDLFGAFGRDFVTADNHRVMVVAITRRQWTGLVSALKLEDDIAALERELGADFSHDEGIRFCHRDRLYPLFERAFRAFSFERLKLIFEAKGVCWGPYQTLKQAVTMDPYFTLANPILSNIRHPSGQVYPAPGAAATLPNETREPPIAAPRLGADTDGVLADIVGLSETEIADLHDRGIVAGA